MDPAASPPPQSLGQAFAAERERQGLSRVDIAQRLHMSPWQVEALESGDYGRLPRGMFLRGFVRNYARALGMDAGAALDRLAESAPAAPAPGIVVPSQNIRFDPLGQRFASPWFRAWTAAAVTVALALAATYWWVFVRPAPPAAAVARKEAPAPQPAPRNLAAAPIAAPEPVTLGEAPREPAAPPPEAAPKAAAEAAASPPAPAPAAPPSMARSEPPAVKPPAASPLVPVQATRPVPGARTVKLRFKGSSWVEIRDRSGKVLLAKLNEPGSEAEVSGRPPFSIVVGNAPDVTMTYDDREFPLEPHTKVAVARFTLE